MANATLQVLIDIKSKLEGLETSVAQMRQLKNETANVSRAGSALSGIFAGIAAGATIQLTQQLQRIPQIITQAARDGIDFNATIESSRIGVASIIKSFDASGKFQNFDAALRESGRAIDFLKQKALETQATFQELLVGYQAAAGPAFAAGINSTRDQINLTVALSQAMSALTIPAREMSQEIRGVFEGDTSRQSRLNNVIRITKAEIDKAALAGTAYQLVMSRLGAFSEGAQRGQQTYNVLLSNTRDLLLQLKAAATEGLFSTLRDSLKDLNAELAKPQAIDFARGIGAVINQEVQGIFILVRALSGLINDLSKIPGGSLLLGTLGREISETFNEAVAQSFVERHNQILQKLREETAATQTMVELGGKNVDIEKQRKALHDEIALILEHVNERTGKLTQEEIKLGEATTKFANEFDRVPGTAATVWDKIKATAEQMERAAKAASALARTRADTAILGAQNIGDDEGASRRRIGETEIEKFKSLLSAGVNEREALDAARDLGVELTSQFEKQRALKQETERTAAAHRAATEFARQATTAIEGIRQQQELINSNSFLTVNDRNAQLLALMKQEIAAINVEVLKGQALLEGGTLDPATYEQVAQKIQQARFEIKLLIGETKELDFGGGLKANLLEWANSFGTVAQQVGRAITGSIGTAIDATADAIAGMIFQTRNWQQAFIQAGQSIVSTLIKIGLQMLVSAVVGKFVRQQSDQGAIQSGATIAGSYAPAAAAASGATSGSNWIFGAIAAAAAIAAIIALLVGFEKGGYTGLGGRTAIAGIVHGQEFVQPKDTVDYYGLGPMEALRQRRIPAGKLQELASGYRYPVTPRYGSFEIGGAVAVLSETASSRESFGDPVRAGDMKTIVINDIHQLRKEILNSTEADIFIVNAVNGNYHRIRKRA